MTTHETHKSTDNRHPQRTFVVEVDIDSATYIRMFRHSIVDNGAPIRDQLANSLGVPYGAILTIVETPNGYVGFTSPEVEA